MATVTISGLECGVLYSVTAGGMLNNGTLVGSRSSPGITIQSCPTVATQEPDPSN